MTNYLKGEYGATCLMVDFDGTLAPIVSDPESATLVDGAAEALGELASSLGRVAIVSGRPLAFLMARFPIEVLKDVFLAGSYGAELGGAATGTDELCDAEDELLRQAHREARSILAREVEIEVKPYSFTLHFRNAPQEESNVQRCVSLLVQRFGVGVLQAKSAVELFSGAPPSKGTIVRRWGRHFPVVYYLGDDVSDIEAFSALDELAHEGSLVMKIAVATIGTPSSLVEGADLVLEDPAAVVSWMVGLRGITS